jgi:mannose-6-phosphate isomerase-like protein (cupin superfamily)
LTPDGSTEQTAEIASGDALLIPTGYRFWVENTGQDDLIFLCCGTPPWPGPDEAIVWEETLLCPV